MFNLQDTLVSTDNHGHSGTYANQIYFICPKGHGVFLPMEYVVHHSKDIKERPTPAYPMNARPHGIALVMVIKEYQDDQVCKGAEFDTQSFISTFKHLQYTVRPYTNVTSLQMVQLVEDIASMDHTAYDSFVCCISAGGCNNHYVRCSDDKCVNVYELVDKIQQCLTLQEKPKLFFIACDRHPIAMQSLPASSCGIGSDTLIMWSTQKNKANILCHKGGSIFVLALEKSFKFKSKTSELISMTDEISAFTSMFPPRFSKRLGMCQGQCPEVESQLKNKVFFFNEDVLGE